MSGPDLSSPAPGSNAIGSFQIGVSGFGTIPAFDPWDTIISQFANSPQLTALILYLFALIDQTANMDALFDKIRNLDTAQGYGLDVWARIVAIDRVLKVAAGPRYFGFEEGLPDYDPFNVSPLYGGQELTQNYIVTDDGFRVMIIAKAFANVCDGSIQSINRLLVTLFGSSGRCYVVDNMDMTMTYKFEFGLSALQYAILTNSGVMPKPAGVSYTVSSL